MIYPPSELIINPDGSAFHLHIRPEQLADRVILVGDPGRVETVASHFDTRECNISSREFCTVTGTYHDKRITVLSTRDKTKKAKIHQFHFIVNDRITYNSISQFRHEESRKLAEKWMKMVAECNTVSGQLEDLRHQYHVANSEKRAELATKILPLEQRYEKLAAGLRTLEKEIRAFEQR